MTSSARVSNSGFLSNLLGLFQTMRPKQWTKSVFVFAALVFDGKLLQPSMLWRAVAAFVIFSLAASTVYILNDLVDIEKDRQHPTKQSRPLPSGRLNPGFAAVTGILLALISLGAAFWLEFWMGAIILLYLAQNLAYSHYLKHIVIVDVLVVSFGFLLRVIAGVVVVQVTNFSPWLYVCSALLTLFIGFGKRRHELVLLEDGAGDHRAVLTGYNLAFLDQIITLIITSMLVAYTLYTIEAPTALAGSDRMLLTVPFVFYFILRYLYLIHVSQKGGAPEELLFEDKPLLFGVIFWAISVVAAIYVF